MNKKDLPVWKLAYSFSVYIILPENTHQYLFTAADNSPWNIFPLAICDFQTTFLKTRIKATEVSILATSAGHLIYWRYGKTREFRVKLNFAPKNSRTFYPELSLFTVSSIYQMTSRPGPCVHCLQAKPFYALHVINILTNLWSLMIL